MIFINMEIDKRPFRYLSYLTIFNKCRSSRCASSPPAPERGPGVRAREGCRSGWRGLGWGGWPEAAWGARPDNHDGRVRAARDPPSPTRRHTGSGEKQVARPRGKRAME